MNKKGLSTLSLVGSLIVIIVIILAMIFLVGDATDKGGETIKEYLEQSDYDDDGLKNIIDPCPCDSKDDPYAVRYVIDDLVWVSNDERGYKLFKEEVHNISAIARDEIINYLALKNTGNEDVKLHLPEPEKDYLLDSLDEQPSPTLFCFNGASGDDKMCTPADFERDFLKIKKDGAGTLFSPNNLETVCATPKDECIQKINDAKYLDEDSKEDSA
ncbi:MAG: hypothetical protein ACLFNM_00185 [Candidatus Woesearchaeota archaeon]